MLFLLYKHTDAGVFDDFPKISDHVPNISEDFPKLFRRPDERSRTFSENFRKFPRMSEDCRRLPKTFEGDPKVFRWYTNEVKFNLRDKSSISSHVRISYRFYQFVTTRYTTGFYTIYRGYYTVARNMNFMFEWREQYLTSERSERVKYCSCHENIKFISSG